jgi:hypothetical protein
MTTIKMLRQVISLASTLGSRAVTSGLGTSILPNSVNPISADPMVPN